MEPLIDVYDLSDQHGHVTRTGIFMALHKKVSIETILHTLDSRDGVHTPIDPRSFDAWDATHDSLLGVVFHLQLGSNHGIPNAAMWQTLVDAGADVNHVEGDGDTLLTEVCRHNEQGRTQAGDVVKAVNWLLGHGAQVDGVGANAQRPTTPLIAACRNGNGAWDTLIAHGADVHRRDAMGDSAVLAAVYNEEALRALIDAGANLADRDSFGQSVLHRAVAMGSQNVIDRLIQAGANVNAQDRAGNTPLHLVIREQHARQRRSRHMLMGDAPQLKARLNSLLKAGGDPNVENDAGNTPLHVVSQQPKPSLPSVRTLLNHGADGDIQNNKGVSALEALTNSLSIHGKGHTAWDDQRIAVLMNELEALVLHRAAHSSAARLPKTVVRRRL